MTTKEQERKALAQIKKIVEGLGENSYIATAFDGALEIAETNIEFDFADSVKGLIENRDKQIHELEEDIEKLTKDIEAKEKRIEALVKESNEAWEAVRKAESRNIPADKKNYIITYLGKRGAAVEKNMVQSAETMAAFADHPNDIAFQAAAKAIKEAREERHQIEMMVKSLIVKE